MNFICLLGTPSAFAQDLPCSNVFITEDFYINALPLLLFLPQPLKCSAVSFRTTQISPAGGFGVGRVAGFDQFRGVLLLFWWLLIELLN